MEVFYTPALHFAHLLLVALQRISPVVAFGQALTPPVCCRHLLCFQRCARRTWGTLFLSLLAALSFGYKRRRMKTYQFSEMGFVLHFSETPFIFCLS